MARAQAFGDHFYGPQSLALKFFDQARGLRGIGLDQDRGDQVFERLPLPRKAAACADIHEREASFVEQFWQGWKRFHRDAWVLERAMTFAGIPPAEKMYSGLAGAAICPHGSKSGDWSMASVTLTARPCSTM